jgi:hypothetical protein
MIRKLLPWAVLLAGCASGGGGAPAAETVRAKVDRWLAAALKAHEVRTHATGEHAAARAEMSRVESELRAQSRPRVLQTVDEALSDIRDCLKEFESRRSAILVAGRTLTADEEQEAEQLGYETETFLLAEGFLQDLRRDFE